MKTTLLQYRPRSLWLSAIVLLSCLTNAGHAAEYPQEKSPAVTTMSPSGNPLAGPDQNARQAPHILPDSAASAVTYALTGQDFVCLRSHTKCGHQSLPADTFSTARTSALSADSRTGRADRTGLVNDAEDIPEYYLELLADIQDADYPDPDLFWKAISARLRLEGYNNILRRKLFDNMEKLASVQIDAPLLRALRPELGKAVAARLTTLQDRRFSYTSELEKAVEQLFIVQAEQFERYRPRLLALARKSHPYDKSTVMQIGGPSCGCNHENLGGQVYGLYPYWLRKPYIDFGVQTRIGYYGLSFDDQGNIPYAERWSEREADFIPVARAHGNKVDLVIYRNDWASWSPPDTPQNTAAFANLTANIVKLLDIPLNDLASRAKPYLTLGLSAAPVMGDGITLYFEDYPQDSESVAAFSLFLDTLGRKLHSHERSRSLNIMLRSRDMGKGIFGYQELFEHLNHIEDHDLHILYLVLIEEPTSNDKKMLRQNIENALHGEQRQLLLRHVVTVLTFDGHNKNQLRDDIIYAKDNFGGIGFWGQSGHTSAMKVGKVLRTDYTDPQSTRSRLKTVLCKLACPR